MPTNTPNLNLIKPLVSEHYDVATANANNDILDNAVGDVYTKSEVDGLVADKQDALVSGTNIKTINGATILDSGNLQLAPQATTYTKDEVDAQVGLLAQKADPTFTGTQTLPNIITNGIKFPATQVPSADPNTLDDYEEGTFTPNYVGATTAGVATGTQVGTYTKVGNLVHCDIYISTTAHTGSGDMKITGLPFAPKTSVERGMTPMGVWNGAFTGQLYALPNSDGSLSVLLLNNGGISGLALDPSINIRLSLTYKTN